MVSKKMRDSVQTRTVRDAILDATDELLIKFGYKKMTIDDLAREVGIGKGTVYLHFPSKEEIALSHIDRIIERLKTKLWEIANSNASPEKKIRSMLIERVMFRFDAVQHYTTSLNELFAQLRPRLLARRSRTVLAIGCSRNSHATAGLGASGRGRSRYGGAQKQRKQQREENSHTGRLTSSVPAGWLIREDSI